MPGTINHEFESNCGRCYLSLVTPAFNEAENVARLVEEIEAVAASLDSPFEIIVVDDASTDPTAARLRDLMDRHPHLRVIRMRQHSGKSSALVAGLCHAQGTYVAILDADLQNDPADIPAMLVPLTTDQCDFVNGWRIKRNDRWLRRVSSRVANGIRNALTREQVRDSACGLKVMRRECLTNLMTFRGMHRFLPTLVRMQGFRVMEVPVNHRPRTADRPKYGLLNRLIGPLADTLAVRWLQNRRIIKDYEEVER